MSEQAKTEMSCGDQGRGAPWYPLRKWWQPSRLLNQDVGLPPLLEPGDARWMDVERLQRSLAGCFIPAPLFVPYISGSVHHNGQKISKWRVGMDVAHFSPSEISLSVRHGFLEVEGRHEERPDEHGFIARCFTRKYRLPAEVDVTNITSTLSVDGILTVEAPVPETSVPAAILIPIKVEKGSTGEEEEASGTDADTCSAPGHPESSEDQAETSPSDSQLGSTSFGLQQHEERREEEEETREKPAGESHPSVPADDEGTESLQDSPEHREMLESQEGPETSKQLEHKEAAVDGEIQVMASSEEAAVEITQAVEQELGASPQSDVQSQELEAADIKQEHTE
ncbi:heat shock protein beta-1 [Acanthochromis polyacanthus]|uniref:heat shock protein beta-1 n=1 Tax=Acanthochromis polyacanthus TaxID=80966 RepID=UPI002234A4B3|nr:heat shock protein beta-1 [Acanthochromis polyacanthus]